MRHSKIFVDHKCRSHGNKHNRLRAIGRKLKVTGDLRSHGLMVIFNRFDRINACILVFFFLAFIQLHPTPYGAHLSRLRRSRSVASRPKKDSLRSPRGRLVASLLHQRQLLLPLCQWRLLRRRTLCTIPRWESSMFTV